MTKLMRDGAPPDVRDGIPFLAGMRMWRGVAGWGFWVSLVMLLFSPPLALIPFAVLCVGSVGALTWMFRAASNDAGTGYAVRHLLLAIILWPVLFVGVFVVTRLVEVDLVTWRLAERPRI